MESAEEFLKENCKSEDWIASKDELKDFLSTNNVIEYMNSYTKAHLAEIIELCSTQLEAAEKCAQIRKNCFTVNEDQRSNENVRYEEAFNGYLVGLIDLATKLKKKYLEIG